jgi:hypothetical protein
MRRIVLLVTVALVMAAMMVAAAPVFASPEDSFGHQCRLPAVGPDDPHGGKPAFPCEKAAKPPPK